MWRDFLRFFHRLAGTGPQRISMDPRYEADRRAAGRRLRLLSLAVLLFIVALVVFARPVSRAIKGRHADQLAAESASALARRDFRLAADRLRQAAALAPWRSEVTLAQARLMNAIAHPGAVAAWELALTNAPPSPSLQVELALALARADRLPEAEAALARAGAARGEARGCFVDGLLASRRGDLRRAEECLRAATRQDPEDRSARLALGRLLLEAGAAEGTALLEGLRGDASTGRTATTLLLAQARRAGQWPQALALARELAAPPEGTADDLITLAALLADSGDPGGLSALLIQARTAALTDRKLAGRVLAWHVQRREFPAAREWLSRLPPEIRNARELMPAAAALAHAEGAAGVALLRDLLRSGDWSGLEVLRWAYSARLAEAERDPAGRRDRWARAEAAAADGREELLRLRALAREWRWGREQLRVLRALARLPEREVETALLVEWHEAAAALRDSAHVAEATGMLLARGQRTRRVINDHAAALLLSQSGKLETAAALAFENFTAHPSDPDVVATYAASLRAQGRAADALALIDRVAGGSVQPALAFERIAALHALGRTSEAARLAAQLPRQDRFPEEDALLAQVRGPGTGR